MTEDKKILATPKVRKFARELGANVSDIQGNERKGRVTEDDVKNYIANKLNSEKEKFTKENQLIDILRYIFGSGMPTLL